MVYLYMILIVLWITAEEPQQGLRKRLSDRESNILHNKAAKHHSRKIFTNLVAAKYKSEILFFIQFFFFFLWTHLLTIFFF